MPTSEILFRTRGWENEGHLEADNPAGGKSLPISELPLKIDLLNLTIPHLVQLVHHTRLRELTRRYGAVLWNRCFATEGPHLRGATTVPRNRDC